MTATVTPLPGATSPSPPVATEVALQVPRPTRDSAGRRRNPGWPASSGSAPTAVLPDEHAA